MPHDAFLWPDQRDDTNSRPPYRDNIEDLVARDMNARETLILALQDRLGNNTFGGGASDFFAFPHPSGGLRVRLNPGVRWDAATGQPVLTATQDSATVTAPVGNPRYDILALDAAGAVTWITGTAAGSPVLPSVGATQTPLWAVYLRPSTTTIDPFGYDLGTNSFLRHDLRSGLSRPVAVAPSGLILIGDTTFGSAAASFTFSSIPGTYKHLRLVAQAQSSVAAGAGIAMRFNGDSSAIYDVEDARADNTSLSGSRLLAQTSGRIGIMSGTNNAAAAAAIAVDIPNYAGASFHKSYVFSAQWRNAASNADFMHEWGGGLWRSTAAITSITVMAESGNINTNSRLTLYAMN